MAEFIEYKRERMIGDYEQMLRTRLFSEEEIKRISCKREQMEYSIAKPVRRYEEYMDCIKYEKNIIYLMQERMKSRHVRTYPAMLISSITKRIRKLYRVCLAKFPNNMQIWDAYIQFSKKFHYRTDVSNIYEQMMKFYPKQPDVWVRAIIWEFEEHKNITKVRKYCLQGICENGSYLPLFSLYIKIELQVGEQAISQDGEDVELTINRVKLIYDTAKKNAPDISLYIDILSIVQNFEFVPSIEEEIIRDMEKLYARNELFWHTLALRELMGLHRKVNGEEDDPSVYETSNENQAITRPRIKYLAKRIENCINVYEKATSELKTEKIWRHYLDEMVKLNDNLSEEPNLKRSALGKAFKDAHDTGFLSEMYYSVYLILLSNSKDNNEYILEVLDKATSLYKYSAKLWIKKMEFYIQQEDEEELLEVFKEARRCLTSSKASEVWERLIEFYQEERQNLVRAEELMKEAIADCPNVSDHFQNFYINWMFKNKDIAYIREEYHKMTKNSLPCYNLHRSMISYEMEQSPINTTEIRKCFEYNVTFFGQKIGQPWHDYIDFECRQGDVKRAEALVQRAKRTLNEEIAEMFSGNYQLFISSSNE